jgi:Fe-S cluster assembly protein SufD
MTGLETLPTRKHEDFRYSNLDALAGLWPVAREEFTVAAGKSEARRIIETGEGTLARHLVVTLEAGACLDLRVLSAGPSFARIALEVTLREGARFMLGAAQLGSGGDTLEIVTDVTHAEGDATSRQIVRSALAGQATGTCLGRIAVARGADGSDADQSLRAMLLDSTAIANARPELEIFADDVKVAHGCAVGELDAAGLFYLQSRGLTPAEARRLMLQAFIAEAFAGAADEEELCETAVRQLEAVL